MREILVIMWPSLRPSTHPLHVSQCQMSHFLPAPYKDMENDNNLSVIYILVKNELTALRAESSFRRNVNVYTDVDIKNTARLS